MVQGNFPEAGAIWRWDIHLKALAVIHGILQARILERVAFPSSRGSSQPRDRTQVSHIAGGFFTICATREPPLAEQCS